MRAFAITPDDGRDLRPWFAPLAARFTDVVLRESTGDLADLAAAARDAGLTPWLHVRHPEARTLQVEAGLHLTAGADATPRPHGRSCHDASALDGAFAQGARYAFLSPVFAPNSKPDDTRPTLGIDGFLAQAAGRPVVALGGIDAHRAHALQRAGAYGYAVLGGIFGGSLENLSDRVAAFPARISRGRTPPDRR